MRICVLDGSAAPHAGGLEVWVSAFCETLEDKGGEVERITLRDLGIKPCTGCWSCWWATPGRCIRRDGMETAYRALLRSDLTVWAVPLVLGAAPALVKHAQDRMIPLIHPYIRLADGECHHRGRYAHYPELGLVMEPGNGDEAGDIELAGMLWKRFALNMKSSLRFALTTAREAREVAHEAYRD